MKFVNLFQILCFGFSLCNSFNENKTHVQRFKHTSLTHLYKYKGFGIWVREGAILPFIGTV